MNSSEAFVLKPNDPVTCFNPYNKIGYKAVVIQVLDEGMTLKETLKYFNGSILAYESRFDPPIVTVLYQGSIYPWRWDYVEHVLEQMEYTCQKCGIDIVTDVPIKYMERVRLGIPTEYAFEHWEYPSKWPIILRLCYDCFR